MPSPLEIQPKEIEFDLSDKEPTTVLKIRNVSDEQIAFKVKTTMPKRYLVRPNQDVVDGGKTVDVRISLQTKEARAIKQDRLSGANVDEKPDKILIQSVQLRPEYQALVEETRAEESGNQVSDVLQKMWQETTKNQLNSTKLQCTFNFPEPDETTAAINHAQARGSATATAAELEDIHKLRKKYNELVNFTVQLTSERDRLRTSYKETTKELQAMRQRENISGDDGKYQGSGGSTMATVSGGFPLWQVMLVAVFSFLLARIIGSDLL
mmetsp:Transcript_8091/g.9158  ORF Transcript_8091/g.9158 Transcript_8091/m.9158 type:complete len:267 (-) Transcript_8091:195-995(-)